MKKVILCIFTILTCIVNTKAQTLTGTITNQPCNNDGVYAVTATGLTPPISYTYYVGGGSVIHSGVNSLTDQVTNFSSTNYGTISCSASDGTNTAWCQNNYNVPFYVNNSVINPLCPSTTGTLSAYTYSGTPGPFTYNWTNIVTTASIQGSTVTASVGTYSLIVTDQVTGCVVLLNNDTSINITQNSGINLSFSTTPANCTNGTASVTATGGLAPYTYQWSNGANTSSISNLMQGVYTVTVTDSQGCDAINGRYIQQSLFIFANNSVTNASCTQNNGSVIIFPSGGTAPYTYLWDNAQTTQSVSALSGGMYYKVIITDANGCTGTKSNYVGVTTPINVTYSVSPSSCTSPTGSASLTITGGTSPYTITWSTFPVSSGTAINSLPSGQYAFKVVDAVGCVQVGTVYIPPVSTINASLIPVLAVCPSTVGTVSSSVSGTNPPYIYSWSNGATTSNIANAPLGYYSCVITDAVGCSVTKSANLNSVSPVNVGMTVTQASCKYTADGSVMATATGGSAPYIYHWSNGQTTATASGLLTGNMWVTVSDANGCSSSNYTHVGYNASNNTCYCTINGKVFQDLNSNCAIDGGEAGIRNIMIHCSGIGYTFTDVNGNYSFQVPTGTYTLSESVNASYPLASCQSNAVVQTVTASSGCMNTVNFANNVVTLHDLHIITTSYPYNSPIPGNPYYQRVIIENNGTVSEPTIQIAYTNDGQLGSLNANPNLFIQRDAVNYPNWYSVQTGFSNLAPGNSDEMNITYQTPTNIPLGTTVNFYDSTAYAAPINTTWLLDETPWNNVQNYQQTVIGSFDPNFKEVSPKGNGPQGYITSKDSILSYVIHFQNEGTYFAQNISILDTLDNDLDWATLHPGYSDHNYTTTVSENGVVTFKFANINLPWKYQYGDIASSGMVTYTIKRKKNVAQGTEFKNKAAIYFDYNAPVITNTTLNTLNDALTSVEEQKLLDNGDVVLYPNPAGNFVSIDIHTKAESKGQINVLDITGKIWSSQNMTLESGKNTWFENTGNLPAGIYFIQVKCNEILVTKKLVVIK